LTVPRPSDAVAGALLGIAAFWAVSVAFLLALLPVLFPLWGLSPPEVTRPRLLLWYGATAGGTTAFLAVIYACRKLRRYPLARFVLGVIGVALIGLPVAIWLLDSSRYAAGNAAFVAVGTAVPGLCLIGAALARVDA
jgi:hypothetical protein